MTAVRRAAGPAAPPGKVIAGVRPEQFEDAALIDGYQRIRALTFTVTVDLVESLGADKYVYFSTAGEGAQSEQLAELAAESGVGANEFVARVSTESKATSGESLELAMATFEKLMGNDVAPRKEFIVAGAYALDAERIDA